MRCSKVNVLTRREGRESSSLIFNRATKPLIFHLSLRFLFSSDTYAGVSEALGSSSDSQTAEDKIKCRELFLSFLYLRSSSERTRQKKGREGSKKRGNYQEDKQESPSSSWIAFPATQLLSDPAMQSGVLRKQGSASVSFTLWRGCTQVLSFAPAWGPPSVGPWRTQEQKHSRLWSNSTPIQEKLFKLQVPWAYYSRQAKLPTSRRHQAVPPRTFPAAPPPETLCAPMPTPSASLHLFNSSSTVMSQLQCLFI